MNGLGFNLIKNLDSAFELELMSQHGAAVTELELTSQHGAAVTGLELTYHSCRCSATAP